MKNKRAKIDLLIAVREFVGRWSETAWHLTDELLHDIERLDKLEASDDKTSRFASGD